VLTPVLQQELIDNFPLVLKLAHRYKHYGLSYDDVRSAGTVGLTKALIAFDGREAGKTKGSLLFQYVRGYIQNEIKLNRKCGFTIGKKILIDDEKPDDSELEEIDIAENDSKKWDDGKSIYKASVRTVFNRINRGVSLDSPLKGKGGEDSDVTYNEIISISNEEDKRARHNCRQLARIRDVIRRYITNPYELRVLRGFLEGEGINEMAKEWYHGDVKRTESEQLRGVQPQSIRAVYNRAVEKLRKIPREEFYVEAVFG